MICADFRPAEVGNDVTKCSYQCKYGCKCGVSGRNQGFRWRIGGMELTLLSLEGVENTPFNIDPHEPQDFAAKNE